MHIQPIRFTMNQLPLPAGKGKQKGYAIDMPAGSFDNSFYNRPGCLFT